MLDSIYLSESQRIRLILIVAKSEQLLERNGLEQ